MRALHGTAIYTGGGQYSVFGQLDNGYWFAGDNNGCDIFNRDTREETNDGLAFYWWHWCSLHCITYMFEEKEINDMYKDFCERLDAEEEGITNGYEEYSNYLPGEVSKVVFRKER